MDSILLSIRAPFVKEIFSGNKLFEYRKFLPSRPVKKIYIYESAGLGKIVGSAEVVRCVKGSLPSIWDATRVFSGISKQYFYSYFQKQTNANAFCLGDITKYDTPLPLHAIGIERPPQSFLYLEKDVERRIDACEFSVTTLRKSERRIFVAGVHGAGKTALADSMATTLKLERLAASSFLTNQDNVDKTVRNIDLNQSMILNDIEGTSWYQRGGVLDGHFVLKKENSKGGFHRLPIGLFKSISPSQIVLVMTDVDTIARRLLYRDGVLWSDRVLKEMQKLEYEQACKVSHALQIRLKCVRG